YFIILLFTPTIRTAAGIVSLSFATSHNKNLHLYKYFLISSTDGTLPIIFTCSSTTSAGVLITPYAIMSLKSSTFSIVALSPSSFTASLTLASNFLQLQHPEPKTLITIINPPLHSVFFPLLSSFHNFLLHRFHILCILQDSSFQNESLLYTKIYEKTINKYPIIIIPADTMDTKIAKSLS